MIKRRGTITTIPDGIAIPPFIIDIRISQYAQNFTIFELYFSKRMITNNETTIKQSEKKHFGLKIDQQCH
jgi:hypothetical protein